MRLSASIQFKDVVFTGGAYTLLQEDVNQTLSVDEAADVTITVPSLTMVEGDFINIKQKGEGVIQFVADGGVTILSEGDVKKTNGKGSYVSLVKTAEGYDLVGSLESSVGGSYISVTKTELDALITDDALQVGTLYRISDVHPTLYDDGTSSGTTIFLKAATSNKLETQGHGLFYNPKYNQAVDGYGVWTDLISYNIGDKVFWGQYVWQNVNGNVGAKTDILNLDAEWAKLPYDTVNYKIAIDVIGYDYANDMIVMRHELEGDNIVTVSKGDADLFVNDYGLFNPISVFMWGNAFDYNNYKGISGNKVYNSYFENTDFRGSYIQNNTLSGGSYISNNSLNNGNIYNNTLNGYSYIQNNTLSSNSSISYNTLSSNSIIENNTLSGSSNIYNNTLIGSSIIENNTLSSGYIENNTLSSYSDISNNTLSSSSIIENNTFQNAAILQIGLANPITGKTIQKNTFISTKAFNTNMSAATLIYGNYEKTFYKRPDGTNKVRYYNDSDTLVIGNVTD